MRLHAVVTNYRTPTDLQRFCDTFLAHQPQDWWLTIANVDPLPSDRGVAEKYVCDRVDHMVHETNVGYATACNLAVFDSDADYYAFFNADVWFRDDAIGRTLMAMVENGWAIAGPRQVDSKQKLTHAGIFGTHAAPQHRAWHQADKGNNYTDSLPAITVSGAAYFIRSDVWHELTACETYRQFVIGLKKDPVGAFLPTQHYYEETWCSYHASAHGHQVMYYGSATVVHEWHKASPVGGSADQKMKESQAMFRAACDLHQIPRD
jgi:hypothetical protein